MWDSPRLSGREWHSGARKGVLNSHRSLRTRGRKREANECVGMTLVSTPNGFLHFHSRGKRISPSFPSREIHHEKKKKKIRLHVHTPTNRTSERGGSWKNSRHHLHLLQMFSGLVMRFSSRAAIIRIEVGSRRTFLSTSSSRRSGSGKPRIVLIGCGWGGTAFLRDIDTNKFAVTCVSQRDHFLLTPLLASTTVL